MCSKLNELSGLHWAYTKIDTCRVEANAEVLKICILSFGQQGPPKMVAKTLKMTISTERITKFILLFSFICIISCVFIYVHSAYIYHHVRDENLRNIPIQWSLHNTIAVECICSSSCNSVQPKRIQIIHCTLEAQIQLHSVSKLDIALVFSPGLSTPALCSLCSPQRVSGFFFFTSDISYLAPAERPGWRKTGITRLLIFGDFTQKMLLQGPSLPPAAWSHAPLNNQQHAHNQQHVDARRPLWSVLTEAGKRNPVRGCTASADVHMRPHVRRLIGFMTGEAAEVVSRLIACASCDVTLFVNGVLSALLSACGEITLPLCFFPFTPLIWRLSGRAGIKQSSPTGALRVRISSSSGPGCP